MNSTFDLDRLVRRNRDHAVLQLVELLPAVEQRLEAGVADALERTADAVVAADPRRADAQALQLGGGDLVTDVERLGDERRLLQLLLLDAGERALIGKAAARARPRDQLRIDLLAGERRLDQRLALLDHAGARFGRGGEAGDERGAGRVISRAVA